MPPLSSLIPTKWPDIQIDAPLGSGAVRHGVRLHQKKRGHRH